MIRLFVAIELPEDIRRRLASMAGGIPSARWVSEENLHLTLRFIGEVPEDRLDGICAALAAVGGAPFDLTVSGTGHFESRRRVRVLWAGIEPNEELAALHDRVESALVRAGLEPESRKFSAHVALARLHTAPAVRVAAWLTASGAFQAAPVRVETFTLLSSFLSRSGAIYSIVQDFPLLGVTASPEPADPFASETRD
ncbi:MAG: RNA 2',3'-cyclic phosphodiesterase [Alphaproteobacteria bacterium]